MTNGKWKVIVLTIIVLFITTPAYAHTSWTKTQLKAELIRASSHYNVSPTWITKAGIDIVFIGCAESHGAYRARNGNCVGLFQFNSSWHQNKADIRRHQHHTYKTKDWRLCPECSVYRFVRCYRDGGKLAIARHWKSTLGR